MTIAIFYDSDGRITYSGDLDEMTADDITEQLLTAVDYIESDDYPNDETQWVDTGALADRPAIDVDAQWVIAADGVDSVWFEAPADTRVVVNIIDQDRSLAEGDMSDDGLFVFRSLIKGDFIITAIAPFPYQLTQVFVTASGEVVTPTSPPGSPPTRLTLELDMPVIEGLEGISKPKFNYWVWEESLNPEHAAYEITFYTSEADADADTNGVTIGPVVEAFYQDKEDTPIDDGLWARVADLDTAGNRSEKSDWATVTARGVQTPDIETSAVTPIKTDLGDTTNVIKANDMADADLFVATVQGSASGASFTVIPNTDGDLGSSKCKLRFTYTTTASTSDYANLATTPINPCVGSKRYTFSATIDQVSGIPINMRAQLLVDWYELDASGDPVFLSTGSTSDTNLADATLEFSETAPAAAAYFALRMRLGHITTPSAGTRTVDIGSFSARMSNNGIFEYATFSGSVNISAGATNTPMTIVSHHTKAARFVSVAFAFKNVAGGSRAVTVEWRKTPSGGSGSTMLSRDFTLADDGPFYYEFFDDAPTTDSTTYDCRVTNNAGSTLTLAGRYMVTQAYFG